MYGIKPSTYTNIQTYKQTLLNSNSNGKLFYKSQDKTEQRNEEIRNEMKKYKIRRQDPQEIPSNGKRKKYEMLVEKIVYTIHNMNKIN